MTLQDPRTSPNAVVSLDLPPSPVAIALGRSVVRRIVTFTDSDAESSFLVAFTEILANAVDEHQRNGLADTIRVDIEQGPLEAVRVTDSGSGISASELDPTHSHDDVHDSSTDVPERGRGLALARAFVDEVSFESSGTGTVVTLPLQGKGIVR